MFFTLLSIVSCDSEKILENQYGSLSLNISIPRDSTIKPSESDIECVKYKLYGKLNDDVIYESKDYITESSVTVDKLLVGTWTFYGLSTFRVGN